MASGDLSRRVRRRSCCVRASCLSPTVPTPVRAVRSWLEWGLQPAFRSHDVAKRLRFQAERGFKGPVEISYGADADVQALVHRFYSLQSERVEAYRLFEEGHQAYLKSGPSYDFVRYRQLVHEITQAFNGISQEILQIKGQLEGPHGRADLAQHLSRLQDKEKEKLKLTAELQLAKQNVQDHPGVDAHKQEVRELKQKLIQTIEAISEILQDFKYDSEESG
ncbi:required for excision 1-B domain-containing protein [Heteronotia binoei]|uniref:required for excision 1-B domain-containing protein n=1 Tax=Heteronotia binoei TaxID=13085 RepID=UPI002931CB1B|nr:required for excision 1-B domain-containing protein [Heteronotia binoei]